MNRAKLRRLAVSAFELACLAAMVIYLALRRRGEHRPAGTRRDDWAAWEAELQATGSRS